MIRALYTAASGMNAQQANIDNVAHNLANVTRPASRRAASSSRTWSTSRPGSPGAPTSTTAKRRSASRPASACAPSPPRATSAAATCARPTRRSTSRSKATASSRFSCRAARPATRAPARSTSTREGAHRHRRGLSARAADHDSGQRDVGHDLEGRHRLGVDSRARPASQQVGTIELATFQNPAGLRALGGNLFMATTASGEPQVGAAGEDARGTLAQGFARGLERQRRRRDGQHDSRPARLRGELEGDQGRRRNALAGQHHCPLDEPPLRAGRVVLVGSSDGATPATPRRRRRSPPAIDARRAGARRRAGAPSRSPALVGRPRRGQSAAPIVAHARAVGAPRRADAVPACRPHGRAAGRSGSAKPRPSVSVVADAVRTPPRRRARRAARRRRRRGAARPICAAGRSARCRRSTKRSARARARHRHRRRSSPAPTSPPSRSCAPATSCARHARVGDVEIVGDSWSRRERRPRRGRSASSIQETRHATRARVVGTGEVEVVNGR